MPSAQEKSILVTGASGLVGSKVIASLSAQGRRIVSLVRHRSASQTSAQQIRWDLINPLPEDERALAEENLSAVVHLAGDPVFGIWTSAKKKSIYSSRVDGTRNLSRYLAALPRNRRPEVLICASAVGFYGNRRDELLTESSAPGTGFLADTCVQWEAAAQPARDAGIRVVHLRIGIVITNKGGALTAMLPAFRFGLGGRLGSGKQWMSWITLEDLSAAIEHAINNSDLSGPVNAVAPNPITNAEFTSTLAGVFGRPAIVPVPEFALKLLPGGMGEEALVASARVVPEVLLKRNFGFQFPTLGHALQHALGK
ncbi:MAG: hypothetical protein JWN45_2119 [Acidobacteriaceae bacterium]|nr:hypothetical protein [Acidobacteriaceae bacterium]